MFIFKAVLVIKKNVMITEQIRTLEYIQEFLGYSSSSKTTEIYTHISTEAIRNINSPLDNLLGNKENNDKRFRVNMNPKLELL